MRDRFPLALALGLLLTGGLALWLVRTSARSDFADRLSSYGANPHGSRALFLLAQESGLPVSREKHDLVVVPSGVVPVLLGVGTQDSKEIPARVDAGVDDELGDAPATAKSADDQTSSEDSDEDQGDDEQRNALAELMDEHGLSEDEVKELLRFVREGGTLVDVPARAEHNALLDALHVRLEPADVHQGPRALVPAQPSAYTRGVSQLEAKVGAYLALPDDAVPLLVDARTNDPVAALVPLERGQVVIVSAPALAENRWLAHADNAQLWLALLSAASHGDRLAFDEFHHGFTAQRSIAEFAARYGLQFAILQLLFGLAFWAVSLRRFGAARPPPTEHRQMGQEALSASSRLYRAGKHRAFAASLIVNRLAEELAPVGGVSPHSPAEEIAAGLERRSRAELAAGLKQLRAQADQCASEPDLQRVAHDAAELRRSAFPEPSASQRI